MPAPVPEPAEVETSRPTQPAPTPSTVARGSAKLFWAQVLGNAGLFVGLILISRGLGPSGRGTVAFLTVTAIVVAQLSRLGLTEATTVFVARLPEARSALLTNLLLWVLGTASGAILLICGGLLAFPAVRPGGVHVPEIAALAAGMLASALADAGYQFVLGCSRFRFHAFVTVVMAWLYAGLIIVLRLDGQLAVLDVAVVWVLVQAIKAGILLSSSIRDNGLGAPSGALLQEMIPFGLRAWIGSVSTAFNDRIDQVVIALIAAQSTLGIYAVAVNASEILLYLPGSAATAILPLVARSDPGDRVHRALAAFRSVGLLTLGAVVVAALLGPPLLPRVFGEPFRDAVGPFLWLLPGALGYVALGIFSNAMVASSSPGRSSAGPLVALVVGIGLDIALIPSLGATGAAVAATCGYVSGGLTALTLYRLDHPFGPRALLVPRRSDLELLSALARPFRPSAD
jgi:O-antigen/teichoic acid export membrane protein